MVNCVIHQFIALAGLFGFNIIEPIVEKIWPIIKAIGVTKKYFNAALTLYIAYAILVC